MNCVVCDAELAKWELPQPVTIGGQKLMPRALCDKCARENLTPGGSPEALQRLVTNAVDAEAAAKLRAETLLPWEKP